MFDGVCDTHCSIRDAVHEASAAPGTHEIVIPGLPDPYLVQIPCSGGPENNNQCGDFDLYVNGSGSSTLLIRGVPSGQYPVVITSTLTGMQRERLFHIPPPTEGRIAPAVTFQTLMLQDGHQIHQTSDTFGGGCVGNESEQPLTFVSVFLTDCVRESSAIGPRGGGAIDTMGDLTVFDGRVQTSTSFNTRGGGIYASGAVEINGALIQYNQTTGGTPGSARGGGLYVIGTSDVQLSGVEWLANQARGDGGAVYVQSAPLISSGNEFRENTSIEGSGGAIYAGTGTTQILTSEFRSNSALDGGGAVRAVVPSTGAGVPWFIRRSSFSANVAGDSSNSADGGALLLIGHGSGSSSGIDSTTLSGNTAVGDGVIDAVGGALALRGAGSHTLAIEHVTFFGNNADDGREGHATAAWTTTIARSIVFTAAADSKDCTGGGDWVTERNARNFLGGQECADDPDSERQTSTLGSLQWVGGNPTRIHLVSSLLADFVAEADCVGVDQHGSSRVVSANCAVGAHQP